MKELRFFDVDCRIGVNNMPFPDAAGLLAEMDKYGVDYALVRHNALMQGAELSNADLVDLLQADTEKRLTGVWSILPTACDEMGNIDNFFAEMAKNHIGALTLDPFNHRYLPRRIVIGKVMDAARERKVPVLLNAFAGKWNELYDFVEEFSGNILIYVENWGKWGSDRNIRPLLENYENFHFETTAYWVPEGIYDLVEKYGADRILYGSGFPQMNQGNSMLQLKYSKLSDEDLQKVASGNLMRILKEAQL